MSVLGPDDDVTAALGHLPRRIAVVGVSGVGKTTFAARVGERLGLAHTEIDALFHGPGWTPREEFLDDVRTLVAGERWVTEWQYASARPLITARADLLVWLDLPTWRTMSQLVARTVQRRTSGRELWNGNVEASLWRAVRDPDGIIRWGWQTRDAYRDLPARVAVDRADLPVVRLRSHRQSARWLDRFAPVA